MTRPILPRKSKWTREQAVLIRKLARVGEFAIQVATRSIPGDKRGEFYEDLDFIAFMVKEADSVLVPRRHL